MQEQQVDRLARYTLNGRHIEALTIDFWGTIAKDVNITKRRELRRDLLREWLAEHGVALGDNTIYDLLQEYAKHWRDTWLGKQFTPGARDFVNWMADRVEIDPPERSRQDIAERIDDTIQDVPPVPVDGVIEALTTLHEHFPFALVCDTGLSGGRNLDWVLEQFGVLHMFKARVYSDAVGRAKPHRAPFFKASELLDVPQQRLVHIGDRDDTDIKGSKSIGMAAIRFDGAKELAECGPCSMADKVVDSWQDIVDLLLNQAE